MHRSAHRLGITVLAVLATGLTLPGRFFAPRIASAENDDRRAAGEPLEWVLTQLPFSTGFSGMTALEDGRALLVGGNPTLSDPAAASRRAAVYDPERDAWRPAPDYPLAGRQQGGMAVLKDGRVFYGMGSQSIGSPIDFYGNVEFDSHFLRDAALYDPEAGRWSVIRHPFPSSGRTFGAAEVYPALSDGRVIFAGGLDIDESPLNPDGTFWCTRRCDIFDPRRLPGNPWTAGPPMHRRRGGSTPFLLLPDGRVLAVSGVSRIPSGPPTPMVETCEMYNPGPRAVRGQAPNTWLESPPLPLVRGEDYDRVPGDRDVIDPGARFYAQVALLPDGKVLIAGGANTQALAFEGGVVPSGGAASLSVPPAHATAVQTGGGWRVDAIDGEAYFQSDDGRTFDGPLGEIALGGGAPGNTGVFPVIDVGAFDGDAFLPFHRGPVVRIANPAAVSEESAAGMTWSATVPAGDPPQHHVVRISGITGAYRPTGYEGFAPGNGRIIHIRGSAAAKYDDRWLAVWRVIDEGTVDVIVDPDDDLSGLPDRRNGHISWEMKIVIDASNVRKSCVIFDPATNTFDTNVASMSVARFQGIAGRTPEGRLFVAGGIDIADQRLQITNVHASTEIFDARARTWSPGPVMTPIFDPDLPGGEFSSSVFFYGQGVARVGRGATLVTGLNGMDDQGLVLRAPRCGAGGR